MERSFFQEIYHRFTRPWNTAFFGYFLLIVIIFAGFGVGYSYYSAAETPENDWVLVAQNIATYFMAILAASIIDLNICWELENRVSFFIYSFLVFVAGIIILIWIYSLDSNFAFIPAILGCVLAWVTWILANAYNEKLNDANFYKKMREKGKHGKTWGK